MDTSGGTGAGISASERAATAPAMNAAMPAALCSSSESPYTVPPDALRNPGEALTVLYCKSREEGGWPLGPDDRLRVRAFFQAAVTGKVSPPPPPPLLAQDEARWYAEVVAPWLRTHWRPSGVESRPLALRELSVAANALAWALMRYRW